MTLTHSTGATALLLPAQNTHTEHIAYTRTLRFSLCIEYRRTPDRCARWTGSRRAGAPGPPGAGTLRLGATYRNRLDRDTFAQRVGAGCPGHHRLCLSSGLSACEHHSLEQPLSPRPLPPPPPRRRYLQSRRVNTPPSRYMERALRRATRCHMQMPIMRMHWCQHRP